MVVHAAVRACRAGATSSSPTSSWRPARPRRASSSRRCARSPARAAGARPGIDPGATEAVAVRLAPSRPRTAWCPGPPSGEEPPWQSRRSSRSTTSSASWSTASVSPRTTVVDDPQARFEDDGPRLAGLRRDPARDAAGVRVRRSPTRTPRGIDYGRGGDRVRQPAHGRGSAEMAAHTDNEVVIDAPLDFVWERMMDIERWPDLFTEYAKAEVIEQDGDRDPASASPRTPIPTTTARCGAGCPSGWPILRATRRSRGGSRPARSSSWTSSGPSPRTAAARGCGGVQDFSMKPDAPADDEQAEELHEQATRRSR